MLFDDLRFKGTGSVSRGVQLKTPGRSSHRLASGAVLTVGGAL